MQNESLRQPHDRSITIIEGRSKGDGGRRQRCASDERSGSRHRIERLLVALVCAVFAIGPTLRAANYEAGVQQPPKQVSTFCTNFSDGSTHGWGPCPFAPNVGIAIDAPGPSGAPSDKFLHAKDLSGASAICTGPEYLGNWTELATRGCMTLCFDVKIINDGDVSNHLNIAPSVIFISDPGTGTPIRAQFVASFTVSEPLGSNPGWHRVCAPLGLWTGGTLPQNANGAWKMAPTTAPNSDWNTLLANVTAIQFPIDFTSNPAEEVGYDNICIQKGEGCPCLTVSTPNRPPCCLGKDADGNPIYAFSATVTNPASSPVPLTVTGPSGVTVVSYGPQTLPPGSSTVTGTFAVTSSPTMPLCLVFEITLPDIIDTGGISTERLIEQPPAAKTGGASTIIPVKRKCRGTLCFKELTSC